MTNSRETILGRIRAGLTREGTAPTEGPPEVRLRPVAVSPEARVAMMLERVEGVGGVAVRVADLALAREYVAGLTQGMETVASNSEYLAAAGISKLPGVRTGFTVESDVREACASAQFGITSADYGLVDTGTLVLLSSSEARLASLLPPIHIAVVPVTRLLGSLDELFERVPHPADIASSMVFVTGPSRTGDIELQLVRGVHGPGDLYVVLVG